MGLDTAKKYFDYKSIKKEVAFSWSRCLKSGKSRSIIVNKHVNGKDIKNIYFSKAIRNYFFEKVNKINQKLNGGYCFFLINNQFIVEVMSASANIYLKLHALGIKKGFSFYEKYSGTNAVYLAEKMKKPVFILPGHHFCRPLNTYYSIAFPIIDNGSILGYINIINKNIIKNEVICLSDLLTSNIQLKLYNRQSYNNKINFKEGLSEKQLYILKMIANGLTESSLAEELHLSRSTIKYHKQRLYNIFEVNSQIEMVVKAFKNGLLTFEEVDIKKKELGSRSRKCKYNQYK